MIPGDLADDVELGEGGEGGHQTVLFCPVGVSQCVTLVPTTTGGHSRSPQSWREGLTFGIQGVEADSQLSSARPDKSLWEAYVPEG